MRKGTLGVEVLGSDVHAKAGEYEAEAEDWKEGVSKKKGRGGSSKDLVNSIYVSKVYFSKV